MHLYIIYWVGDTPTAEEVQGAEGIFNPNNYRFKADQPMKITNAEFKCWFQRTGNGGACQPFATRMVIKKIKKAQCIIPKETI